MAKRMRLSSKRKLSKRVSKRLSKRVTNRVSKRVSKRKTMRKNRTSRVRRRSVVRRKSMRGGVLPELQDENPDQELIDKAIQGIMTHIMGFSDATPETKISRPYIVLHIGIEEIKINLEQIKSIIMNDTNEQIWIYFYNLLKNDIEVITFNHYGNIIEQMIRINQVMEEKIQEYYEIMIGEIGKSESMVSFTDKDGNITTIRLKDSPLVKLILKVYNEKPKKPILRVFSKKPTNPITPAKETLFIFKIKDFYFKLLKSEEQIDIDKLYEDLYKDLVSILNKQPDQVNKEIRDIRERMAGEYFLNTRGFSELTYDDITDDKFYTAVQGIFINILSRGKDFSAKIVIEPDGLLYQTIKLIYTSIFENKKDVIAYLVDIGNMVDNPEITPSEFIGELRNIQRRIAEIKAEV